MGQGKIGKAEQLGLFPNIVKLVQSKFIRAALWMSRSVSNIFYNWRQVRLGQRLMSG